MVIRLAITFLSALSMMFSGIVLIRTGRARGLAARWAVSRSRPGRAVYGKAKLVAHKGYQLVELCEVLTTGFKCGQSLPQALRTAVEHIGPPLGTEISRVVQSFETGVPLREALQESATRVKDSDLSQLIRVLSVFEKIGSDPTEALSHVARSVQARTEMRAMLAAKQADARISAIIVAFLPAVLALVSFVAQPQNLYRTVVLPSGRMLLAIGLALWAIGTVLVWRISNPEWL